jgi:hypothetical protein
VHGIHFAPDGRQTAFLRQFFQTLFVIHACSPLFSFSFLESNAGRLRALPSGFRFPGFYRFRKPRPEEFLDPDGMRQIGQIREQLQIASLRGPKGRGNPCGRLDYHGPSGLAMTTI